MIWHDVTLPIADGMTVWPGDPPVSVRPLRALGSGDPCNVAALRLGSHSGTHVDAPVHYLSGGGTVDALPLDVLLGPCRVVEFDVASFIDRGDLEGLGCAAGERLLFKTRNSAHLAGGSGRFSSDYVSLTIAAAAFLAECGIALVGIDYLSIEAFAAAQHPVHRMLLGHNIVILEGLDLSAIAPGRYQLICLPLRLEGGDGAPARVLLGDDRD